jgi:hypothetical protein
VHHLIHIQAFWPLNYHRDFLDFAPAFATRLRPKADFGGHRASVGLPAEARPPWRVEDARKRAVGGGRRLVPVG